LNTKGQSHIIYQGEGEKFKSTRSICVLLISRGLFDKNSQLIPGNGSSPHYRENSYKPQAFLVAAGTMQKCHRLADKFMSDFKNKRVISSSFHHPLEKPHPHLRLPLAP